MRLSLFFALLLYPSPQLRSGVHDRPLLDPDPPDTDITKDSEFSQVLQNPPPVMSRITLDIEDELPSSQKILTNADVVRLLMQHTYDTLKEERKYTKETIKDESDLTDEKIKHVIQGLSNVATSAKSFQRANKSELDNLNLKVETYGVYNQDLLFNLKSGIRDTFQLVQEDMNTVWSRLNSIEEALQPRCTLCGNVFQSIDQLVEHAVSYHVPNTSPPNYNRTLGDNLSDRDNQQESEIYQNLDVQSCFTCGLSFPTPFALQTHLEYYHRTEPYVPEESSQNQQLCLCSLCGKKYLSLCHLEQHHLNTHSSISSTVCSNCDRTPTDNSLTRAHNTTHDTPINQFDGADDTLPDTLLPVPVRSQPANDDGVSNNVRVAPYTMDRKKQIARLANDASIDDFEIVVSPNEHNVTIFCSTGFYSLVALPTFANIMIGSSFPVLSMTVSCYDITGKVDSSHANVNTVFFFRVSSDAKSSITKVTIHLHHTARKVQVQGGSLVDKKRASVWFLQNFLLKSFSQVAKDRTVDITKFNNAVKGIVTNHVEKVGRQERCHVCEIPFTGRLLKQMCSVCKERFHKTCLQSEQHLCLGAGSSVPQHGQHTASSLHPRPPAATAPAPQSKDPSALSLSREQSSQQSVLFIPAAPPANKPPDIAPPQTIPPVSEVSLDVTTPVVPTSTLVSPTPPPALPSPPLYAVTTVSSTRTTTTTAQSSQARVKKNASKYFPTLDETGFELECKKKLLATAHAKIQELETDITKLTKTNHILTERIKMFENKNEKEMYDRYFPVHPPPPTTATTKEHLTSVHCFPLPPHHCCPPPPCHWQMRCDKSQETPQLIARNDQLSEKIDQAIINIIQQKSNPSSQDSCGAPLPDIPRKVSPGSPEVIVIENTDHPTPDNISESMELETCPNISAVSDSNTIDENVDEGSRLTNLNSNLPTNQLPQLMYISPQEL